jgi:hypothetical protein
LNFSNPSAIALRAFLLYNGSVFWVIDVPSSFTFFAKCQIAGTRLPDDISGPALGIFINIDQDSLDTFNIMA